MQAGEHRVAHRGDADAGGDGEQRGEARAADADAEADPLHGHDARRDQQLVHLVGNVIVSRAMASRAMARRAVVLSLIHI